MSIPEPSRPDPSVREDGKRGARFVIRRSRLRRNRFWVAAIGSNGETLSHSEQLTSRAAALANVEAQRGLVDAPLEDRT